MSRIALLAPEALTSIRGNNTTVLRLARGLRGRGHDAVEIGDAARVLLAPETLDRLRRTDLLHAFHAFKTGVAVREAALRLGKPYVVSLTGTDLHEDLLRPDRREAVCAVLRDAAALLTPHAAARTAVAPVAAESRCVVVPKGVELPPEVPHARGGTGAPPLFLHVGGWREVKNNLFPLAPLARLALEVPGLRLRFVGPVLDPAYHERWRRDRRRYPFVEEAGAVPAAAMDAEYAAAAVVLNTSHAEGGANAVLEAMAHARVVLASRIPGNEAFLSFDPSHPGRSTGVLYDAPLDPDGRGGRRHDVEDFLGKARQLALDDGLRVSIGLNARAHVAREHSPDRELDLVLTAYRLAGVS